MVKLALFEVTEPASALVTTSCSQYVPFGAPLYSVQVSVKVTEFWTAAKLRVCVKPFVLYEQTVSEKCSAFY